MLDLIQACGRDADARFRTLDGAGGDFDRMAADLLSAWDLPARLSLDTLWEAAAAGTLNGLGDQGKPGLIPLYSGENVRIVGHLWADAADRLHQHDWNGAFQVLAGRSFNARFAFAPRGELGEFAYGPLTRQGFDVFAPGQIQPVREGDALIHSVVYAGKPGLAISLRGPGRGQPGATEYLRPGLRCPSHRRRAADAAQIDLLAQALQSGDTVYAERFAALAGTLAPDALLRLLDTAAFDGLPVPEAVQALAVETLPAGGLLLASLDDIERSDTTRELLSEQDDPLVRDVICALFHSDRRSELAETLRIAGSREPVLALGTGLAAILVDVADGPAPPGYVIAALGEAGLTGDLHSAIAAMRQAAGGDPHADDHAAFLSQAFAAMEEAPVFRSLFVD